MWFLFPSCFVGKVFFEKKKNTIIIVHRYHVIYYIFVFIVHRFTERRPFNAYKILFEPLVRVYVQKKHSNKIIYRIFIYTYIIINIYGHLYVSFSVIRRIHLSLVLYQWKKKKYILFIQEVIRYSFFSFL